MISRRFKPISGLIVLPRVFYAVLLSAFGRMSRAERIFKELGERARPEFVSDVVLSIAFYHRAQKPGFQGNWALCYEYMKAQTDRKPTEAVLWLWLGILQREMGHYTEAGISFDKAEMLIGGVPSYKLMYQRGLLAYNTGNFSEAVDWYAAILETYCDSLTQGCAEFNVKRSLADSYWMLGNGDESVRAYAEIVRMHRRNVSFVPEEIREQVITLANGEIRSEN